MQEATALDCQAIAVRIQRRLDETLDRQAGATEAERQRALLDALRAELGGVPVEARGPVLAAVRALHPDAARLPLPAAGPDAARVAELEAEVERLRAGLAARPDPPPAPPGTPGTVERELLGALIGSGAELDAVLADPALALRMRGVAQALLEFAERLGRVFLGATEDRTMAGQVRGLAGDAVRGRGDPDAFADALERISRQIGAQLLAFREACEVGSRDLLKQLAPAVIEADASRTVSGVSRRFFFYKECWDLLAQRHEALRGSDELFETYFNGAYRSALLRHAARVAEQEAT